MFSSLFGGHQGNGSSPSMDQSNQLMSGLSSPLMAMAAALMASGGYSNMPTTLGQGISQGLMDMDKAQQLRAGQMQRQQQIDLQKQLGQSELAKNAFALSQAQQLAPIQQQQAALGLQQGQQQAELQNQRQTQMQGILGQEPSMVNNFQGSGLLGGDLSPQDALKRAGLITLATGGDQASAADMLGKSIQSQGLPNQLQMQQLKFENDRQLQTSKIGGEYSLKKMESQLEPLNQASAALNSLTAQRAALNNVSGWQVGRIIGKITDLSSADVQTLKSASAQTALTAKSLLGMPNNNFSDADRDFLAGIAGGTDSLKQTTKANIDRLTSLAERAIARAKAMEDYFGTNGNLFGFEEAYSPQRKAPQAQGLLGQGAAMGIVPQNHPLAGQEITAQKPYGSF